jgi:threonine/homoserine/homoserine lactone efflux protein
MSWFDPSFANLMSFVATCLIIELTPGPNMGYLAVLSATAGRRAGYAAVFGVGLGLLIVGVAAAFGLAAAISASPLLFETLRWAGIVYFLWLAWDAWKEGGEPSAGTAKAPFSDSKYFVRGLMTNLLNPKAALFYVAVLPSFIDPAQPVLGQTILLSIVFVAIATTLHASIVFLAATTQRFLQNERRRRLVSRLLSLVLVAIALWFAWSTRH